MEALQALLEDAFASHADKPALLQPDGAAITFGELERRCAALCAQLSAAGARARASVVFDTTNADRASESSPASRRARRGVVVVFADGGDASRGALVAFAEPGAAPDLAAVAAAARPSEVVRLDALPRGSAGKVDRAALRRLAEAKRGLDAPARRLPGAPPAPADVSAVEAWLRELYAALAPGDGDDFLRRGGTSLGAARRPGAAPRSAAAATSSSGPTTTASTGSRARARDGGRAATSAARSRPPAAGRRRRRRDDAGALVGLDADTGRRRWARRSGAPVYGTPALADGVLYYGDVGGAARRGGRAARRLGVHGRRADADLRAAARRGRRRLLRRRPGPPRAAPPRRRRQGVDGGAPGKLFAAPRAAVLVAATTGGVVVVLREDDGALLARARLPAEVFSTPVVAGRRVLLGCRDDHLHALDLDVEYEA
ncbi:hypothetical protein JL722_2771 [Aureococcus anophagefferens]|nr:hypothetical protein JL722_2771 [Aureococcus anophagefferens]